MGNGPAVDGHGHLLPGKGYGGLSYCINLGLLVVDESPYGHVVHHGTLLELVPYGVCVIWVGRLEELFKVIGRLPRLALEVMISSSDVIFIKVTSLLVVVTLIIAGSNDDPLGAPLLPPLIAFGASLRAFADVLGQ
jgi:hypothetical protein